MTQSLDVPSRFSPPDHSDRPSEIPPHLVASHEWAVREVEIAAANFTPLAAFHPDWTDSDFYSRDCASVTLTVLLPKMNNRWQEFDGKDFYYDPDIAYDVRSDLVAALRKMLLTVERDIADRPELKG